MDSTYHCVKVWILDVAFVAGLHDGSRHDKVGKDGCHRAREDDQSIVVGEGDFEGHGGVFASSFCSQALTRLASSSS